MLPYLEQGPLFDQSGQLLARRLYSPGHPRHEGLPVPRPRSALDRRQQLARTDSSLFQQQCLAPSTERVLTNVAGNGTGLTKTTLTLVGITDGTSNTIFVGEKSVATDNYNANSNAGN